VQIAEILRCLFHLLALIEIKGSIPGITDIIDLSVSQIVHHRNISNKQIVANSRFANPICRNQFIRVHVFTIYLKLEHFFLFKNVNTL